MIESILKVMKRPLFRGAETAGSSPPLGATFVEGGVNFSVFSRYASSVDLLPRGYDWEGDAPLHRLSCRTIIYELNVCGFTRNPKVGRQARAPRRLCRLD
jgi:pullulanase/glycogen debranching enzyme